MKALETIVVELATLGDGTAPASLIHAAIEKNTPHSGGQKSLLESVTRMSFLEGKEARACHKILVHNSWLSVPLLFLHQLLICQARVRRLKSSILNSLNGLSNSMTSLPWTPPRLKHLQFHILTKKFNS